MYTAPIFFRNKCLNLFKIIKNKNKLFKTFWSKNVGMVYLSHDKRSTKKSKKFVRVMLKAVSLVLVAKCFMSLNQQ